MTGLGQLRKPNGCRLKSSIGEAAPRRVAPALGTFERYLTLWVALCIIAGIVLRQLVPAPFQVLGRLTVAKVNIPVAILIWLMIVPMLLKVDFGALHRVVEQRRDIAVTVGNNWLVKPFSMALFGWLFVGRLFRPWLPSARIGQLHRRADHPGRRAVQNPSANSTKPRCERGL